MCRVTCWPTFRPFSGPSTSCSGRSIGDFGAAYVRPPPGPAETQPKAFAFSAHNAQWAGHEIAKYPEGRQASAVIPLLWRAQEQVGGWVPQKAIEHVAEVLKMPYIRVLEIATFYTMFQLEPVESISYSSAARRRASSAAPTH